MAKFVLLYGGGGMPATEAEQAAVMQEWEAWYGRLGSAVVDGGNPFAPQATQIASNGSVGAVPAAGKASGYTIIAADSLDSAVALAKGCPILKANGQISVYETGEM
jgi:hypothetical protein